MTLVKQKLGWKVFQFGGGEIKKSFKVTEFPWILISERIRISTDVVDSNIPLLFKLVSAIFYQIFIFSSSDSPS